LLSLLGSLLRGQLGLAYGRFVGGLRLLHGHLIGLLRGLSGLLAASCAAAKAANESERARTEKSCFAWRYPRL